MRPHPQFKTRSIPAVHTLGDFTLRALSVNDLDRDFAAVMESAVDGASWIELAGRFDA